MKYANFFELIGKTIVSIDGLSNGADDIDFKTADGLTYQLRHLQSCCESVGVDEISGRVEDVLNQVITLAEEDSTEPKSAQGRRYSDSHTWSSYRLVTESGNELKFWVLGESNGYYSETMTFKKK